MACVDFWAAWIFERELGGCSERLSSAGQTQDYGRLYPCHMSAYLPGDRLHLEVFTKWRVVSAPAVSRVSRNQGSVDLEQSAGRVHCGADGNRTQSAGCSH